MIPAGNGRAVYLSILAMSAEAFSSVHSLNEMTELGTNRNMCPNGETNLQYPDPNLQACGRDRESRLMVCRPAAGAATLSI